MGDGVAEGVVDLVDLGEGLLAPQVEVVGGDQVRIAGAGPDARYDDAHQADQTARLLEALVLPEAGVEIADRRMERVGLLDAGGELFRRGVGHVHLLRLTHRLAVGVRHRGDAGGVRQALEQAAAQDVVELVRVHPHRLQVHGAAPGFRLQVVERGDDLRAAGAVGGGEVGDHHADVAQLVAAHGDQQVGQRGGRDHREIGVADALGRGIDEVGPQLVEHDDQRLALQQIHPRALPRRGQRRVVVAELLLAAELVGDGAPDPERRVALAP